MSIRARLIKALWKASAIGFKKGHRLSRYYLYTHLSEVSKHLLPASEKKILSISHSERLGQILGLDSENTTIANYPDYNILSLPFPDQSYGFVISDQVLEHIEGDPFQAVQECYRILEPGGMAIHTTCHSYPIHGEPNDYWRFSPYALSLLHKDWSEILEVGGWGNLSTLKAISRNIHTIKVPHAKWHPIHKMAIRNEPNIPITTWIIAKK